MHNHKIIILQNNIDNTQHTQYSNKDSFIYKSYKIYTTEYNCTRNRYFQNCFLCSSPPHPLRARRGGGGGGRVEKIWLSPDTQSVSLDIILETGDQHEAI